MIYVLSAGVVLFSIVAWSMPQFLAVLVPMSAAWGIFAQNMLVRRNEKWMASAELDNDTPPEDGESHGANRTRR